MDQSGGENLLRAQKEKGLLISFDGLDSTGKATQTTRLVDRLRHQGFTVCALQSPDYTTPSGQELKQRLQDKSGTWNTTPWAEKMKLFAANRAEHRSEVLSALEQGEMVVYDRYVPSSMAFMAVEAFLPQQEELFQAEVWRAVEREEYEIQKMPHEDISIFLNVPPKVSAPLLEKRKKVTADKNEYTDHMHVQERLYNEYMSLIDSDPKRFLSIQCVTGNELLGVDDVAELVWVGLTTRFPQLKEKAQGWKQRGRVVWWIDVKNTKSLLRYWSPRCWGQPDTNRSAWSKAKRRKLRRSSVSFSTRRHCYWPPYLR